MKRRRRHPRSLDLPRKLAGDKGIALPPGFFSVGLSP
jgi:hypothetical protein